MTPDSRYRITERVAAGGMAEVFRGVAESMQGFRKNIAIKRILPNLTKNKKFVAMFLDEARLSLSLQHANIVQVFDIGHTEDTYFIVMEYVDGVDLKALTEWRRRIGRRIPVAHTLYLVMEICKGLSYAHEMLNPETGKPLGIVHRDISPPNVLISKQGEVKVVDFGLAKATSQIETTDPGVVKGKMSYLSPEAARGEEVDNRADIFAVGILLYEMLTGKRLFYGETDYQTVELVRNAKIPPLKAQNPQVEPELEDIVRKALARRADDRYRSATDLQDALAHYSYSRGLKVISRDIADLVRQCLDDRRAGSGEAKKQPGSIIDTLLQDEIVKFTSVDFEDPGARPLSPEDLSSPGAEGSTPGVGGSGAGLPTGGGGDFIDPRAWANERLTPAIGVEQLEGLGLDRRDTISDAASIAMQAAQARQTGQVPQVRQTGQVPQVRQTGKEQKAVPPPAIPNAKIDPALAGPTPGPEALANVLEPASFTAPPSPPRLEPRKSVPGRGLLIGALVALVVLAATLAVVLSHKSAPAGAPPRPAPTETPH
jgi:serine/threonine-protein kinase